MPFIRALPITVPTTAAAADNPIDSNRRIDWSLAGVEGGIPHRTNVYDTLTSSATAAQINTAIANCSSAGGGVVELGAGTYSLSTKIKMKSNVTLRGQGMSTILRFTGVGSGDNEFFFGTSQVAVYFGGSYDASGYNTYPFDNVELGGYPSSKIKAWNGCGGSSGSYPKGATVLNLASAPTGLAAGDMLLLFQLAEDPATSEPDATPLSGQGTNSVPRNGYWTTTKRTSSPRSDGTVWEGAAGGSVPKQQRVRVVSVSGNDVTIWPGLMHPTGSWKSGLSPQVAWHGSDIRMAGIEDCRIDCNTSGPNGQWAAVQFWQASNCWITRCWVQPRTGQAQGSNTYGIVHMYESRNLTIKSNWIGPGAGGAQGTTTTYGAPTLGATLCLIENNVFQGVESPMLMKGHSFGNVYAYNYEVENGTYEGGYQYHEAGVEYTLGEGNHTLKIYGDLHHGATMMNTVFRSYIYANFCINLQAYHRYFNAVGNVLNSATRYTTDCDDVTLYSRDSDYAFRTGMPNQQSNLDAFFNPGNGGVTKDSQVLATLFRWGNYTAHDTTTRFLSAECPTGAAEFPNSVPASQTLPSSMYLSARPSWFTFNGVTGTWPPIGPDVTGGSLHGGRVHDLPAKRAYDNAAGSGANFNPSLYG